MEVRQEDAQRVIDELYSFARKEMAEGKTAEEVENALMEKGVDLASAVTIVHDCEAGEVASITTRGSLAPVVWGGVICLIGLVVTVGSYSAASGGGTYVVAWGAILFGALQMIQGLSQL